MSSYSSKFVPSIEPAEKPNSLKNLHVMALGDSDIAKKMEEQKDIWELRVSASYRLTFQISGDTYILRRVGTHDVLKKP